MEQMEALYCAHFAAQKVAMETRSTQRDKPPHHKTGPVATTRSAAMKARGSSSGGAEAYTRVR